MSRKGGGRVLLWASIFIVSFQRGRTDYQGNWRRLAWHTPCVLVALCCHRDRSNLINSIITNIGWKKMLWSELNRWPCGVAWCWGGGCNNLFSGWVRVFVVCVPSFHFFLPDRHMFMISWSLSHAGVRSAYA